MIDPFVVLVMIAVMIWLGVQVLTQRSAIRELESRLDGIDDEVMAPKPAMRGSRQVSA